MKPEKPPIYPVGTTVTFFYGSYPHAMLGIVDSVYAVGNLWAYSVSDADGIAEFHGLWEESLSIPEKDTAR